MVKVQIRATEVKREELMHVAFDIGQKNLDLCYSYQDQNDGLFRDCTNQVKNNSNSILCELKDLEATAKINGYKGLWIVCEPTGGFERKLLSLARQRGNYTSYVNPESVHKLKVVENNDASKNDTKDPQVILLLQRLNKTLKHRILPSEHRSLRKLGVQYEAVSQDIAHTRNQVFRNVQECFPDYPFDCDWLYTKGGQALWNYFKFNPERIARETEESLKKALKQDGGNPRREKVQELILAANCSLLHETDDLLQEIYEEQLGHLFEQWKLLTKRLEKLKCKILKIYRKTKESEQFEPLETTFKINPVQLARIVAETGPLDDFESASQVLKFAGLSLRTRQSGKYVGQRKLSKKGRPLLRKILYQITFSYLIKKNGIYYDYYHERVPESKKDRPAGIVLKTMVSIMRKFLPALFGIYNRKTVFNPERIRNQAFASKAA